MRKSASPQKTKIYIYIYTYTASAHLFFIIIHPALLINCANIFLHPTAFTQLYCRLQKYCCFVNRKGVCQMHVICL